MCTFVCNESYTLNVNETEINQINGGPGLSVKLQYGGGGGGALDQGD